MNPLRLYELLFLRPRPIYDTPEKKSRAGRVSDDVRAARSALVEAKRLQAIEKRDRLAKEKQAKEAKRIEDLDCRKILLLVSITIVVTGGDITPAIYLVVKEFFELHAVAYFFGTERGNGENNLHLQGTAKIRLH